MEHTKINAAGAGLIEEWEYKADPVIQILSDKVFHFIQIKTPSVQKKQDNNYPIQSAMMNTSSTSYTFLNL